MGLRLCLWTDPKTTQASSGVINAHAQIASLNVMDFCLWGSLTRRRTNVQLLTCNIDLSCSFYYLFFSFVLIELEPFALKRKVLGGKVLKKCEKKCGKVWKFLILPFSCCPLVFPWKKVFPGLPARSVKKVSKKIQRTRQRVKKVSKSVFGDFSTLFWHSGRGGPGRTFFRLFGEPFHPKPGHLKMAFFSARSRLHGAFSV